MPARWLDGSCTRRSDLPQSGNVLACGNNWHAACTVKRRGGQVPLSFPPTTPARLGAKVKSWMCESPSESVCPIHGRASHEPTRARLCCAAFSQLSRSLSPGPLRERRVGGAAGERQEPTPAPLADSARPHACTNKHIFALARPRRPREGSSATFGSFSLRHSSSPFTGWMS